MRPRAQELRSELANPVGQPRLIVAKAGEFGTAALAALHQAIAGLEAPVIGLATGHTPVPLYEEMVRQSFAFPARTRLFAIDEYCTTRPEPGTNAAFFERYLPRSNYPAVRVPRHDAHEPEVEIVQFCREIARAGGFDVAVLGIGMNGHVAFNEPGSAPTSGCRVVTLSPATRAQVAVEWEAVPTLGMTVGMAQILAARHMLLLARGEAKSAVVAAALAGPITSDVPASLLRNHTSLTVVCDSDAASRLDGLSARG